MPSPSQSGVAAPAITFTLDVEDHRPNSSAELRFPHLTREVLSFLDALGVTGTFFIVGQKGTEHPELVREIAEAGHEIGLHAWVHEPITERTRSRFAEETRRGKEALEDLSGSAVVGFRAPTFSITPGVPWAPEVLSELGFAYSSSVLPGRNPLFSWPGAPERPFRWESGLIEFPGFLYGHAPAQVPMFGGVYARTLPMHFIENGFAQMAATSIAHLYCHPYDFDPGERYYVVPDVGPVLSPLLWMRRRGWYERVRRLMANPAPPFRDRLDEAAQRFDLDTTPMPMCAAAPAGDAAPLKDLANV